MKESKQISYIENELKKINFCNFNIDLVQGINIDNINIENIEKIFKKSYISTQEMQIILCLFNSIILNFPTLNNKKNLITKINKLSSEQQGVKGKVFIGEIFNDKNIHIIIKTCKNLLHDKNAFICEYFIGITGINKLRSLVPNFALTLGIFDCSLDEKNKNDVKICTKNDTKVPFLMIEKINGNTMDKKFIEFDKWLVNYIQILLSLEVAQRNIHFTHFDLHPGNIIINEDKVHDYSILLDENEYLFKNLISIPYIIDFGLSSFKHNNTYIGTYEYETYGIVPYMIPGFDMYKILTFYIANNLKETDKEIDKFLLIYEFWNNEDPYEIYQAAIKPNNKTKRNKILSNARREYVSKITYSKAANKTPLQLFKWLFNKFPDILNKVITIKPRTKFINIISYKNQMQTWNDLLIYNLSRENENNFINSCLNVNFCKKVNSYIYLTYFIMILIYSNRHIKSDIVNNKITEIILYLQNNTNKLIKNDRLLLDSFFSIKLPNEQIIQETINTILNNTIKEYTNKSKHILNNNLLLNFTEYKKINLFLNLYYTITEIENYHYLSQDIKKYIDSWKDKLNKSKIISFYNNYKLKIQQTERWANILIYINKN